MITKESLITGVFYDGFIWHRGKQQRTEIMLWDGKVFHDFNITYRYRGMGDHTDGFEPNVVSTEWKDEGP